MNFSIFLLEAESQLSSAFFLSTIGLALAVNELQKGNCFWPEKDVLSARK